MIKRCKKLAVSEKPSWLVAAVQVYICAILQCFGYNRGGGVTLTWHMYCICACLLGCYFAKFGIAIGAWVFIRNEGAQMI